jgi:hypothetical protein
MAATAQPTLESAHAGQKSVVVARTPAGVKMRAVASLVAYERDPRTHSAEQRSWPPASRYSKNNASAVLGDNGHSLVFKSGETIPVPWR